MNQETGLSWNADYLTHSFARIIGECGIRNANLHILRHTFASHRAMQGVSLHAKGIGSEPLMILTNRELHKSHKCL